MREKSKRNLFFDDLDDYGRKEVRTDRIDLHQKIWKLYCVQCGAGTDYFETTKEAIKAWNRRVDNGVDGNNA